jgi:hypothetical protein
VSFSNNVATRRNNWGRLAFGISRAGKIYLPTEPAPQPTALPGDDNGAAAASTLPAAASPSAAGQFPAMKKDEGRMQKVAKLGLRYER